MAGISPAGNAALEWMPTLLGSGRLAGLMEGNEGWKQGRLQDAAHVGLAVHHAPVGVVAYLASRPAPPTLALCAPEETWVTKQMPAPTTFWAAESSTVAARFPDLAPAAAAGCIAFLGITAQVAAAPGADGSLPTATLLLGFPSPASLTRGAAREAHALLSWALAEEASLAGVANVLGLVGDLLSPHHGFSWLNSAGASPVPPRSEGDSSSSDREGPGSDDEETEQNGDAATASPWTLCFPSPRLEQRFRVWHNSQMFKLDAFGFVFCEAAMLYILFAPGRVFQLWAKTGGSLAMMLHSHLGLLPGLLLLTVRTRRWYCRHREIILLHVFCSITSWAMFRRHYSELIPDDVFTNPLYLHGFTFLAPSILFWQIRFCYLAPLALFAAAADCALMLPFICTRFYPGVATGACVGVNLLRVLLLMLLGPLSCAYLIEGHARRLFYVRDGR